MQTSFFNCHLVEVVRVARNVVQYGGGRPPVLVAQHIVHLPLRVILGHRHLLCANRSARQCVAREVSRVLAMNRQQLMFESLESMVNAQHVVRLPLRVILGHRHLLQDTQLKTVLDKEVSALAELLFAEHDTYAQTL